MIWLVEWGKIIVLPVRHAFRCNFLTFWWQFFIIEVLTTKWTRSSKCFIFCLYMETICAKKVKVHFTYFVKPDQHGIIANHWLTQISILMWRFCCSCRRSWLPIFPWKVTKDSCVDATLIACKHLRLIVSAHVLLINIKIFNGIYDFAKYPIVTSFGLFDIKLFFVVWKKILFTLRMQILRLLVEIQENITAFKSFILCH